jgi:YidC/Oxa1 family membrane protein insertase
LTVQLYFANVLQPLVDFFEGILKFFHDSVGLGWGTSIIALTVLVRAALLPLTLKQFKSMQRLAQFQPEIKRLQERHKEDKERLNQEMMRFYRENKVNPFASCLPMVAQLPVFLSLFYMLRKDLRHDICPQINPPGIPNPKPCGETDASSFFFIPDLTSRATGAVLVGLVVLYVGSQLLSTVLMSTTTDRNQKLIMYALPFFFVAFAWQFPAGLLVYWITTNLWTIVQQTIVRRRLGPLRPPDPVTAAAVAAGGDAGPAPPERGPAGTRGAGSGVDVPAEREPVAAGARKGAPPPPPRKKRKRSGRRR